jgi:hypothetical protein
MSWHCSVWIQERCSVEAGRRHDRRVKQYRYSYHDGDVCPDHGERVVRA